MSFFLNSKDTKKNRKVFFSIICYLMDVITFSINFSLPDFLVYAYYVFTRALNGIYKISEEYTYATRSVRNISQNFINEIESLNVHMSYMQYTSMLLLVKKILSPFTRFFSIIVLMSHP